MIRLHHVGLDRAGGSRPALLDDISLEIGASAFRWLLGPSGAGKTSLLRVIGMGERPTRGRVSLFGTDTFAEARRAGRGAGSGAARMAGRGLTPKLRRRIGVVHQDFRLLPELSLFDNVALPLRLARRREPELVREVCDMLAWLGLGDRLDALPRQLSGGEQQRAAIARAVVGRPSLLLADEPTGNLDDAQAARVLRLFVELNRTGSTVVVATHNAALVEAFPAPAIRLLAGRLVAHG